MIQKCDVTQDTASDTVASVPVIFHGCGVRSTDGAVVSVIVYDNTAASGRVVASGRTDAAGTSIFIGPGAIGKCVYCPIGLYVSISGTASVETYYNQA